MNQRRMIEDYREYREGREEQDETSDHTGNDTIQDLRNDIERLEKENELIKASLKQLCYLIGIEFESHPYYETRTLLNGKADSGDNQPLYELLKNT